MTDSETLRMERTFQTPAEAVREAWTSEDVIRRGWHAGHDWKTTGRSQRDPPKRVAPPPVWKRASAAANTRRPAWTYGGHLALSSRRFRKSRIAAATA